jgi:hypothetical protein
MVLGSDGTQFLLHRVDVAADGHPSYYPNHTKPNFTKLYVSLHFYMGSSWRSESHRQFTTSNLGSKGKGLSMALKILETHGIEQFMLTLYIDRLPGQCVKGMLPFVSTTSNVLFTY